MQEALPMEQIKPAYAPYPTFCNAIGRFKDMGLPSTVDRTALDNLSGAAQSHVTGTFRFLGLLTDSLEPTVAMERLVASHGTSEWKDKIGALIDHAYRHILSDIDVQKTTYKQLSDAFRDRGPTEGSVTEKAVRFYLKAMEDAGRTYSSHLGKRPRGRPRGGGTSKRSRQAKAAQVSNEVSDKINEPLDDSMMEFPIHLPGKPSGKIVLPKELSGHDIQVIQAQIAVVKLYVSPNSPDF